MTAAEKNSFADSASVALPEVWARRPRCEIIEGLSAWQAGEGQPVVLIHGVGLNADAWGAQARPLSAHCQLTAIDMPGHGDSQLLPGNPTLVDFSNPVATAIKTLGKPVILIGHSMGALLALDIAMRFPSRAKAVVAMNAIFQRSAEALQAVQQRASQLTGASNPDPTPTLSRGFGDALETADATACRQWLAQVNPAGYQQAYRVFANDPGPSPRELAQLSVPALFITGSNEPNSTPAMSRAMAELAPAGQAAVVDGAAHMMPMTHAPQVNQHLLTFIGGV